MANADALMVLLTNIMVRTVDDDYRHVAEEEEDAAAAAEVNDENANNDGGNNSIYFHCGAHLVDQSAYAEHLETVEELKLDAWDQNDDFKLKFIRENPTVFQESMQKNGAIQSALINLGDDIHDNQYDIEHLAPLIARSLKDKPSFRKFSLEIHGTYAYNFLPTFLEHVGQQITVLHLRISILRSAEPPPTEVYDTALRHCRLLEELEIKLYSSEEKEILFNPFPYSLSALPKLQKLTLDALVRYRRPLLRGFSSIENVVELRELTLISFTLDGRCNMALAKTIENSRNLIHIRLQNCRITGGNIGALGGALGAAPSLRTLDLSCPNDSQLYFALAHAVSNNKSITTVSLRNLDDQGESGGSFHSLVGLHYILEGIKIADSITTLTLTRYCLNNLVCEGLCTYLASSTSLLSLKLEYRTGFSDRDLHQICTGAAESPSIKELFISCSSTSFITSSQRSQSALTAQGLIQGVTIIKNSQTLETLSLIVGPEFRNITAALLGCITELETKSTIKVLKIQQLSYIFTLVEEHVQRQQLSLEEGMALVKSLSKNLSLTECPFSLLDNVSEEDKNCVDKSTSIIFKLNKHARRYLVEGKSKNRGVALLGAVADDLDCIYFHLLENPTLCK